MVLLSWSGTDGGIHAKLANGVAQYNCAPFGLLPRDRVALDQSRLEAEAEHWLQFIEQLIKEIWFPSKKRLQPGKNKAASWSEDNRDVESLWREIEGVSHPLRTEKGLPLLVTRSSGRDVDFALPRFGTRRKRGP